MSVIITAERVNFSFGSTEVLSDISFEIQRGDYVALIGPNGGGKTTLLKLLLGLLKSSQGKIQLLGGSPAQAARGGRIGYVPQFTGGRAFDFPATVEEVVASGRTPKLGLGQRFSMQDKEKVTLALEKTGLADIRRKLIPELSGGQRQRAFIARALAAEPELLFLDEPVAGVDISQQERFYQLLSNLNQQDGLTLIFVSHDVGIMSQQANRFLCLNRKLVCHDKPEQFLTEEFMSEVYGKDLTPLTHHHH